MNSEFPFLVYYLGVLIGTVFLSRFIFAKYIGFAKTYNLVKATNSRAAHKGLVFTGGGVVYAAVIMVAALILDNVDFVDDFKNDDRIDERVIRVDVCNDDFEVRNV